MSKEIDAEANNLCTTQDAFEKFQSVSMYEEDEYITLSDIVSPSHNNHDLTEMLTDSVGNNDSASMQVAQEESYTETLSTTPVVNENAEKPAQNIKLKTTRKRGRSKKKNGIQSYVIEESNCSSSKILEHKPSNQIMNKELSKKDESKNLQKVIATTLENSKSIEERATRNSSVNLSNELEAQYKPTKRRGRPPKSRNIAIPTYKEPENNLLNKTGVGEGKVNISKRLPRNRFHKKNKINCTAPKTLKKDESTDIEQDCDSDKQKSIKKNLPLNDMNISENIQTKENICDSKSNISEDDIEDLPLVALSAKNTKIKEIVDTVENINLGPEIEENKILNNLASNPGKQIVQTNSFSKKKHKKRGRPRKHQIVYGTDTNKDEEITNNESQIYEGDDISLSKLKGSTIISKDDTNVPKENENVITHIQDLKDHSGGKNTVCKRNSKKPAMSDYEYNIDNIVSYEVNNDITDENPNSSEAPLTESSRPVRRKAKKNLHYDEGSDEDPFANVELSDDEPRRRKRGGRLYSDDEYIPDAQRSCNRQLELTDTDTNVEEEVLDNGKKHRKKKYRKSNLTSQKSPKKISKQNIEDAMSLNDNIDVELNLETSVIRIDEDKNCEQNTSWGAANEFENFLAKIVQGTDIKIKKAKNIDSTKAPLQIPVIDPTMDKKCLEVSTQTDNVKTKSIAVQTNTLYEIPMKNQVTLTAEQSQRAIEFLSGIVKTTSELGQLMTEKSDDFIAKKINTTYVTDTFKMDYCVKKSFLLFKLAKHNLIQMEEDLSKQYENFLKENNLIQHREEQKVITSTPKALESDSDCEIVEEPVKKKSKEKITFNPKTVFLNKELSIKIAKKPAEAPNAKEKINIKGRHTVWINDSVMVKKVQPTQSFLAQDSRNKKPPDTFITIKMVSDFFKMYEHQKAISLCAPYINNKFFQRETNYICHYSFETTNNPVESYIPSGEVATYNEIGSNEINNTILLSNLNRSCPDSLLSICTKVLQRLMYFGNNPVESYIPSGEVATYNEIGSNEINNTILLSNLNRSCPDSLLSICTKVLQRLMYFGNTLNDKTCSKNDGVYFKNVTLQYKQNSGESHLEDLNTNGNNMYIINQKGKIFSAPTLKNFCYKKIYQLIYVPNFSKNETENVTANITEKINNPTICEDNNILHCTEKSNCNYMGKSLSSMCIKVLQNQFKNTNESEKATLHKVNTLKHLALTIINKLFDHNLKAVEHTSMCDRNDINQVKSLSLLCIELISSKITTTCRNYDVPSGMLLDYENQTPHEISLKFIALKNIISLMNNYNKNDSMLNFTIDNVNTVSEDIFLENQEYNNEHERDDLSDDNYYSDNDLEANYQDDVGDETSWVAQVQLQELRSCVDSIKESYVSNKENSLVKIKMEPLEDLDGNTIDSTAAIKIEPADEQENLQNFTPIDIITKQEDAITSIKSTQRKYSRNYDGDQFESFVTTNTIIKALKCNDNENIFTQSAHRIRRQYEPDSDNENDNFCDILNLLVPQSEESTKDRLMASSSDEETNKKTSNKKRKPKSKKNKCPVEPKKEKITENIEMLTRRMKKKIMEEKNIYCSDSEMDDINLNINKKNYNKVIDKSSSDPVHNLQEKQIQCNDVDSTEHIIESQKEDRNENDLTPLFSADEPIEVLQCTPSIISKRYDDETENHVKSDPKTSSSNTQTNDVTYVNRHGWSCYPINARDRKIYQYVFVLLDKLPESFVETYNKYQNISAKSYIDSEIDKLTNLQSLHRSQTKGNIRKPKKNPTNKSTSDTTEANIHSDYEIVPERCLELSLSGDEGDTMDHNIVNNILQRNSENNLAKNILMENYSDGEDKELKIKEEPMEDVSPKTRSRRVIKPTRSDGEEKAKEEPENLMLTADKVMDKDLKLLHAPIKIQELTDLTDTEHKPNTRNSNKKVTKSNVIKIQIKDEDASSSEEEKQWVTTKEKLLKRLGKKIDTPSVDAKRAKILSEFIEKRNDGIDTTWKRSRPRRRSKKKLLERRKQMKILSKELFGDESHTGKKYQSQAYSRGRRNIRKVLDKKSLARSTVLANMDEFERKRRLGQREAQLREVLGCEEGVNVVVINDELCLEYDFENKLPLVTVHSFFTKIMKAHQYEGVKFMWDACFESVSAATRDGGGGGGCILAHCMGLGKTLQVLALLHTVLTHPQLSMRRVLVCCPLSTVLNWVDEINKWIGPVTNQIKVFELSKLKKTYLRAYQLEDWYNGGGIFIIGYELFRSLSTLDPIMDCVRPTIVNKIRTALLDPGPDIVICDEGHLLKNDSSVLAVAMNRVVTKRRIILTGTPMQNNLKEYYCMVNFVKPNLLGTYSEYSNRFENPIMNGQHRDSREEDIKLMKARTHILHKVLEGCLQRQEASVLYPYLPKKYEYTVFISQTKCQWDLYKHYLNNYSKDAKQSVIKDFHVLQKIWTHPQVLHSFLTRARGEEKDEIKAEKIEDDLAQEELIASEVMKPGATDAWWLQHVADTNLLDTLESSNKFLVVFHLLDECIALDDKVLIFSTSLYTMDSLEFFLRRIKQWSLGKDYYRLDGSVPAEVRQKWCREFNAPSNTVTKLFLISTRAGSLGLNMTAANRVIILDTSWNPAHDIQSIFRVYRFGQKKACHIYRLVALGTMEQKMYERSVTKQAVACRVVDEQQIDRHYNMAELSELYRLDEDGYSVPAGLAPGVRDGVLLRVARALGAAGGPGEVNALHAVHEHDSLLRGSGETGLPEHERNAAWMQFQQEHSSTHKKIQNIKIKNSSIQKDDCDQTDVEIEEEPTDKPKRHNPRLKKGKKNVIVEDDLTVLPSTSTQIDPSLSPDLEQETVKKIMNILIKHKFHESKGPIEIEISELITKVREVVANIDESGLNNVDPLTASIARVLIDSEKPAGSDRIREDVNALSTAGIDVKPAIEITVSYNEATGTDDQEDIESDRKRRKQRSDSDEEYVPDAHTSRSSRKKEKLKAIEKQANKKSNESSFTDNVPIHSELPNTRSYGVQNSILMQAAQSLPSSLSSRLNLEQEKSKASNLNDKPTVVPIENDANEISIILSDDDSDEPVQEYSTRDKDKPVPLHKSLLSNKNFVKIVAHTYLTGNPKLDEDAAVLAAQYSTFKALKDIETTGKELVSGPIYDIAIQVLGIPLLQKLQHIHNNKKDGVTDLNEETSFSVTSVLTSKETTRSQIDKTEVSVKLKNKMNKTLQGTSEKANKPNFQKVKESDNLFRINSIVTENLTAASPKPTEVVPVGMFEGPASFQPCEPPEHEECILPDDDDVIITDLIPATTTSLNIKTRSKSDSIPPLAKSSVNMNEKTVGLKSKTNTQKMCPSKTTAMTSIKQNTSTKKFMIHKAPDPKQSSEKSNETICLDSDEEEEAIIPTPKLKGKALKSTTKLPSTSQSLLKSQANTSRNFINIAPKLQNSISPENNKTRQTLDTVSVAKKKLVSSKHDDIIRITEGGKVEILRRAENVLTDDVKANVATSQVSSKDKNKPKIQKVEKKDKINTTNDENILDVLNLSDSDDESPLSVIQNVVHIRADKYEEPHKAITIKEPETSVPNVINKVINSSKTELNKTSLTTGTEVKKPVVNNLLTTNKKIPLKNPSNTASTPKKDEKVIDLTENLHSTDNKIILTKKKDWDKVSGSSKDIIINKVGAIYKTSKSTSTATSSSVDLSGVTSENRFHDYHDIRNKTNTTSINKEGSSLLKVTASGSTKRSCPWQETTAKKKTESKIPMLLQDFEIDDFDDIIELE